LIESSDTQWRELESNKDEFLRILRLLVEFDERTGHHLRRDDPAQHWLRKGISLAESSSIRILLRNLNNFVYSVLIEMKTASSFVTTGWVHEDGIRAERDQKNNDRSHPVHSIVCVTDLFEKSEVASIDNLNPATKKLMEGDPVIT